MTTNPDDPAYPLKYTHYREAMPDIERVFGGLTKREYFAAMALQGILANPALLENKQYQEKVVLEKVAVLMADALIVELSK